MTRLSFAVGLVVAFWLVPAQAQVMTDTPTLLLILEQLRASVKGARENLAELRDNTAFASETAGFAREMVQVGKNVHTIVNNPREFSTYMANSWYRVFPEARDILGNSYSVRQSIYEAAHPEDMPRYDDMAYVRVFDRMADSTISGYEVWAHAVDRWGINATHDQAIENIGKQREIALDNLERMADVMNTTGLSPVQASIYTAQSSAVSAVAQTQAAATLESLARTIELGIIGSSAERELSRTAAAREERRALQLQTGIWELDPMRGRRRLRW